MCGGAEKITEIESQNQKENEIENTTTIDESLSCWSF